MKNGIGSLDKITGALIALAVIILYFTHIISGAVALFLLVGAVAFLLNSYLGIRPTSIKRNNTDSK